MAHVAPLYCQLARGRRSTDRPISHDRTRPWPLGDRYDDPCTSRSFEFRTRAPPRGHTCPPRDRGRMFRAPPRPRTRAVPHPPKRPHPHQANTPGRPHPYETGPTPAQAAPKPPQRPHSTPPSGLRTSLGPHAPRPLRLPPHQRPRSAPKKNSGFGLISGFGRHSASHLSARICSPTQGQQSPEASTSA